MCVVATGLLAPARLRVRTRDAGRGLRAVCAHTPRCARAQALPVRHCLHHVCAIPRACGLLWPLHTPLSSGQCAHRRRRDTLSPRLRRSQLVRRLQITYDWIKKQIEAEGGNTAQYASSQVVSTSAPKALGELYAGDNGKQ